MRLLLFDIDGTLLRVDGGGQTAIVQAVEHVTGHTVSLDNVSFSGRTDPNILRDVLTTNELPTNEDLLSEVTRVYAETAQETIHSTNVMPLTGATPLLSRLANRNDTVLGLVTGNIETVAFHKLRTAGLADHFSIGGFGSDHANRSKLPGLAVRRAAEHTGHSFSLENTVVIGDTEHDITSARRAGACAVAVSTGRPSSSDLASHEPDLLLKDFDTPNEIESQLLAV